MNWIDFQFIWKQLLTFQAARDHRFRKVFTPPSNHISTPIDQSAKLLTAGFSQSFQSPMLLTIFCESSWNGNTSKVISWQCRVLMTFTLRIFNPVVLLDYMSGSAKWWNCHRNFAPILLHFARRSDQAAFESLFFYYTECNERKNNK